MLDPQPGHPKPEKNVLAPSLEAMAPTPARARDVVLRDVGPVLLSLKGSLRALLHVVDPQVGIGAALIAALASFWTASNVIVLICMGAAMVLNILSGAIAAHKLGTFSGKVLVGGLMGKLLRINIVAVAGLSDLVLAAILSGSEGEAVRNFAFALKASAIVVFVAEARSVLENARKTEGDLPVLAVVMRSLDRLLAGGHEPPARRHYDRPALELEDELKVPQDEPTNPRRTQ